MRSRLYGALLVAGLLAMTACSSERGGETAALPTGPAQQNGTVTTTAPTVDPATSDPASTAPAVSTAAPTSTSVPRPTTTTTTGPKRTTTTTTPEPTTTTSTTTTTTTVPPLPGVKNPKCVIEIKQGESLFLIAKRINKKKVTVAGLQLENGITDPDRINAGDYLDICVGNEIDDITGKEHEPPTTPPPTTPPTLPPGTPIGSGVHAQQEKLNFLFAGKGMPPLAVDGDSGSLTEQQLCAARIALGLPASRADMAAGSPEEFILMTAAGLSIPSGAPTWASRWALIDQTCQVMFVGDSSGQIVFVFPTSTGQSEFPTRDQDGSAVFRYDPALENGGWHDSTDFPASIDNPLNGNMYKPLYFDNGQAIHGANSVPTYPASHGCVRLRLENQDALVLWLGLHDADGPTWSESEIGLVVSIRGDY